MFKIMLTDCYKEITLAIFECKDWEDFQKKANECWCNLCETLPRNMKTIFVRIEMPLYYDDVHCHTMNCQSYYDLYDNKIYL